MLHRRTQVLHIQQVMLHCFYIFRESSHASLLNLTMKLVFLAFLLMFLSISAMGADPLGIDMRSDGYGSPHEKLKHAVYTVNIMGRRGGIGGDIHKGKEMLRNGKGVAPRPPTASSYRPYPPSPPDILS